MKQSSIQGAYLDLVEDLRLKRVSKVTVVRGRVTCTPTQMTTIADLAAIPVFDLSSTDSDLDHSVSKMESLATPLMLGGHVRLPYPQCAFLYRNSRVSADEPIWVSCYVCDQHADGVMQIQSFVRYCEIGRSRNRTLMERWSLENLEAHWIPGERITCRCDPAGFAEDAITLHTQQFFFRVWLLFHHIDQITQSASGRAEKLEYDGEPVLRVIQRRTKLGLPDVPPIRKLHIHPPKPGRPAETIVVDDVSRRVNRTSRLVRGYWRPNQVRPGKHFVPSYWWPRQKAPEGAPPSPWYEVV